jgi:hypothetical protein
VDPPSCQQAIGHYYTAGCTYTDLDADPPSPISQGQMITLCQQSAIAAPDRCQDDLDAWLVCNGDVPSPSSSSSDCDCSKEFMALLRCE